jgi:hypothetical protein
MISRSTEDLAAPRSASAPSSTSRARLTQHPHWVLQPVSKLSSRRDRTPFRAACLIADSVTALQIQMYMVGLYVTQAQYFLTQIINVNENDCQLRSEASKPTPFGLNRIQVRIGHWLQQGEGLLIDPALERDHVVDRVPEIDPLE